MTTEETVRKIIETAEKVKDMRSIIAQLKKLETELNEEEWGELNFNENAPFLIEEFKNHVEEIVEELQEPVKKTLLFTRSVG